MAPPFANFVTVYTITIVSNLRLILLFLVFFCAGVGLLFLSRYLRVRFSSPPPFTPKQSTFELLPPSQSLTANTSVASGYPLVKPRDATQSGLLMQSRTLIEGDTIITDATSSAQFTVGDQTVIASLAENAEVVLSDTQPTHFLLVQRSGNVSYISQLTESLSIRVSSALVVLNQGYSNVELLYNPSSQLLTVEMLRGGGQFSLIDIDNNTQVESLVEGDVAEINMRTKTFEVTSKY